MAKAIVISHPSEVIRKGLLNLLENEVLARIVCCSASEEIKDEWFETYSDILIIWDNCHGEDLLLEKLSGKKNNLFLIAVTHDVNLSSGNCDYVYKLNAPAAELIEQVKSFINDNKETEPDDELTQREKDVLRLIALGHTNKSIADTLFISTHTVISHRKNITEKLGIKSIPGLTVYAIIQKIISHADVTNDQLG